MAQHHRLLDPHRAKAAVLEVMQIRAANAAVGYPDPQLARAKGVGLKGVEAQVQRGVANECAHAFLR